MKSEANPDARIADPPVDARRAGRVLDKLFILTFVAGMGLGYWHHRAVMSLTDWVWLAVVKALAGGCIVGAAFSVMSGKTVTPLFFLPNGLGPMRGIERQEKPFSFWLSVLLFTVIGLVAVYL